ncbi:MAG: acyl-CoA desaturase [Cyanobacteria bacterium P01_C01_bin.38]
MQLNDKIENLTNLSKKKNITIKGNHLKTQQFIHALVINIIPLLGTILAVEIALKSGIGKVEIGLLVSLYILTLVGISVGFHRLFSHSTFQAHIAVKILLAILGSMACQGPLIYWVSNHRRHHQYSDKPGDPHSPYYIEEEAIDPILGLWHAQVGWTFTHEITNTFLFAKDLLRDSYSESMAEKFKSKSKRSCKSGRRESSN